MGLPFSRHEISRAFRTLDPRTGRLRLSRRDAEILNGLIDEYERLDKISAAAPLVWTSGPEGRSLGLGGNSGSGTSSGFWAMVRGSSGSGSSPYGWDECDPVSGSLITGGRSSSSGAYEVNGLSSLGAKIVRLYPVASSTWLFNFARRPWCSFCGLPQTNLTLTTTYMLLGGGSTGTLTIPMTLQPVGTNSAIYTANPSNPYGIGPSIKGLTWRSACTHFPNAGQPGLPGTSLDFVGTNDWIFELFCNAATGALTPLAYGYNNSVYGSPPCSPFPGTMPDTSPFPGRADFGIFPLYPNPIQYCSGTVNRTPIFVFDNTSTCSPLHLRWVSSTWNFPYSCFGSPSVAQDGWGDWIISP